MFFKDIPTSKNRLGSRPSLMIGGTINNNPNYIQRNSIIEDPTKLSENVKNIKAKPKQLSNQFNDKRLDTSSLLIVNKEKVGSKSSFHESRILTRSKTRNRTRKLPNSIINDTSGHPHSNIIHSKTSVGNNSNANGNANMTQTTMQQDLLIFFDQVFNLNKFHIKITLGFFIPQLLPRKQCGTHS